MPQIGQTNPLITVGATPVQISPSRSVNNPRAGYIINNVGAAQVNIGFSTGGVIANINLPIVGGGERSGDTESGFAGNVLPNGDIWAVCPSGTTQISFTEW